MTEPSVELRAATKRYGPVEAVRGIDLRIEPGTLVALLGPNGAGKTTAISLMLGLRAPSSGQAFLFGLDPRDRRARSRTGVMLQESGVSGLLTVAETVSLFRTYYPDPLPAGEAIAMAGLQDKARASVTGLSGGQRQRLYFALAVCGNPELLFLDEPTVGMDVDGRRAFIESIREFARAGKTIVLTTHYLEEADALAQRVVVVNQGKVIADATPAEIKSRVAGKKVSFTVAGGLAAGVLDGLPISGSELDGDRVKLLSNEPEALLRELFRRGVALADLEVTGADLEEAFIALTKEVA